jgi:hypothetical protein
MIPGTVPNKEDFKSLLLTAWQSKLPLLCELLYPQVFVKEGETRVELAFV